MTSCRPIQSVIIFVINKSDDAQREFDFVITRMITDRIGLHSVLLPLLILKILMCSYFLNKLGFTTSLNNSKIP